MCQLWDLVLVEAHGVTLDEAIEQGLRFHVADFQIAESQASAIRAAMNAWRGPRAVATFWFSEAPGSYDDDAADAATHTTGATNAHIEDGQA